MKIWINPENWIERQEDSSRVTVVPFRTIEIYISRIDAVVSLRKEGIFLGDLFIRGKFEYTIDILKSEKNKSLYILNCYKKGEKRTPCPSFVWESEKSILDTSREVYPREVLDLFGFEYSKKEQDDEIEFSLDF